MKSFEGICTIVRAKTIWFVFSYRETVCVFITNLPPWEDSSHVDNVEMEDTLVTGGLPTCWQGSQAETLQSTNCRARTIVCFLKYSSWQNHLKWHYCSINKLRGITRDSKRNRNVILLKGFACGVSVSFKRPFTSITYTNSWSSKNIKTSLNNRNEQHHDMDENLIQSAHAFLPLWQECMLYYSKFIDSIWACCLVRLATFLSYFFFTVLSESNCQAFAEWEAREKHRFLNDFDLGLKGFIA